MSEETYITTINSRKIDYERPDPRQIDFRDLAHALSNIRRFATHTTKFYSVAEHCFNVSVLCSALGEDPMWGLMHDAEEAYTGDIPSPLKKAVPGFRMVQDRLTMAVAQAFGLKGHQVPLGVKKIDRELLSHEGLHLTYGNWPPSSVLMPVVAELPLTCLAPAEASEIFIRRFQQLRGIS